MASLVFLTGTGLLQYFRHPFYQWWLYALSFDGNARVALWLKIGAGVGTLPPLLMIAAVIAHGRRVVGPRLRRPFFGGAVRSPLAITDNHGHARWMESEQSRRRFPGPDKGYGGRCRRRGTIASIRAGSPTRRLSHRIPRHGAPEERRPCSSIHAKWVQRTRCSSPGAAAIRRQPPYPPSCIGLAQL